MVRCADWIGLMSEAGSVVLGGLELSHLLAPVDSAWLCAGHGVWSRPLNVPLPTAFLRLMKRQCCLNASPALKGVQELPGAAVGGHLSESPYGQIDGYLKTFICCYCQYPQTSNGWTLLSVSVRPVMPSWPSVRWIGRRSCRGRAAPWLRPSGWFPQAPTCAGRADGPRP